MRKEKIVYAIKKDEEFNNLSYYINIYFFR